jgi:orotate phosphoribosyltransferase
MTYEHNKELARKIYEIAHITGDFLLRSGQRSTEYFDKYRFEAEPSILSLVAKESKHFIKPDHQALAGLETGGIPLATALSLESGLPVCFVRKEAKTYGTCQFAEGIEVKDKNLFVIEDVVTTGGQLKESIRDLRSNGAVITDALCVIMRGPESEIQKVFKEELDVNLNWLFTKSELER